MIVLALTACLLAEPAKCKDFEIETSFDNTHQCMLFNQQILAAEMQTPKFSKYRLKRVKCVLRGPDEREA